MDECSNELRVRGSFEAEIGALLFSLDVRLQQDEAFELGQQWANLYPADSESNKILNDIFSTYYLINIVHNDYRDPDPLAIFKPVLGETPEWTELHQHATTNGSDKQVNGVTINGH